MVKYWQKRPAHTMQPVPDAPTTSTYAMTSFAQHHQTLLACGEEGWVTELGCYLGDFPQDAMSDMDIIQYWQDNHRIYPTLGWIALDFLPCQASFVPCECLFSASKHVATDCHARLGTQ